MYHGSHLKTELTPLHNYGMLLHFVAFVTKHSYIYAVNTDFTSVKNGIGEFNIRAPKACLQLKSKTTQICFNIGLQRVCNPFVVKNELG